MNKAALLFFAVIISLSNPCFAQSNTETIIGKQIWSKQYLSITNFSNGDPISYAKTEEEWRISGEKKIPCYTLLKDKSGNVVQPNIHLYNWYVVNDPRGISPKGFRVPTNSDILELLNFCGGACETSNKLKSSNDWDKYSPIHYSIGTNGNDEFGFSIKPIPPILPSGFQDESFHQSGFWTSSEPKDGAAVRGFMSEETEVHYPGHVAYSFNLTFEECMEVICQYYKEGGLPIILIKDNPERGGYNYPIYIHSNTIENFEAEKNMHIESLCLNFDSVSSEKITHDSIILLKATYQKKGISRVLYFDQSNLQKTSKNAGIGAKISVESGKPVIVKIVKGGACDLSKSIAYGDTIDGMFKNDNFIKFDNLEIDSVLKYLRGPENEKISLVVTSYQRGNSSKIDLYRKKIPNWEFKEQSDRAITRFALAILLGNENFGKQTKRPDSLANENESTYAYMLSKASRLYSCGPNNYRANDYFNYPKEAWNKNGIITGVNQIALELKGSSKHNPIKLSSIIDAENLMMIFHFKKEFSEIIDKKTNLYKVSFVHLVDKGKFSIFFQLEN